MVPFAVVLIAAVVVYLWHQRSRENEALAEYPGALIRLANGRDSIDNPTAEARALRDMASAVFQASGNPSVWRGWTPEHRNEIRRQLALASSPFLIEEAGMPPGSPRHHFTYSAVMRRLKRIG